MRLSEILFNRAVLKFVLVMLVPFRGVAFQARPGVAQEEAVASASVVISQNPHIHGKILHIDKSVKPADSARF